MAEVPANQAIEVVLPTRWNRKFAGIAESLKPTLYEWIERPVSTVKFVSDEAAFFQYRGKFDLSIEDLSRKLFGKGDDIILDFETHRVGYLSFHLAAEGLNIDAPTRLRLTFGEICHDVIENLQPCNTWISSSWIPEEVMTIDWPPQDVHVARRHAFRYVRIQVIDTSPKYKVSFQDIRVRAVSAVSPTTNPTPLCTELTDVVNIDQIALRTLRDCMQTVFEDGPRRDRRMWLGDLRLQALASHYTYQDFPLVKRCLYMFAALPREDGSLPATLFEFPRLRPATDYIVDYDALFGPTVYDYVLHSGDKETGGALWDTVIGSMNVALKHISPSGAFDSSLTKAWKFCDWVENVQLDGAMHGLVLFCCKKNNALAELLGIKAPFTAEVRALQEAAMSFVDTEQDIFVSGSKAEISWTNAAWLSLAEFLPKSKAKQYLLNSIKHPNAIKPLTPYSWHHVVEALAVVGAEKESLELIRFYWGGMAEAGADTFWECYDSEDCRASPYGDSHNNSFCHAWSCTPSYLFRTVLKNYLGNL